MAVFPPLVGLGSTAEWVYRALALLVIGCPCALVISTPVSVVASLSAAAETAFWYGQVVHRHTASKPQRRDFHLTLKCTSASILAIDGRLL